MVAGKLLTLASFRLGAPSACLILEMELFIIGNRRLSGNRDIAASRRCAENVPAPQEVITATDKDRRRR